MSDRVRFYGRDEIVRKGGYSEIDFGWIVGGIYRIDLEWFFGCVV